MPTLKQLRTQIEKIDVMIIKKLAERKKLSIQIGKLKAKVGKSVVDKTREKQLFLFYKKLSEKYHLQSRLVNQLFKIIINYSRRLQK